MSYKSNKITLNLKSAPIDGGQMYILVTNPRPTIFHAQGTLLNWSQQTILLFYVNIWLVASFIDIKLSMTGDT